MKRALNPCFSALTRIKVEERRGKEMTSERRGLTTITPTVADDDGAADCQEPGGTPQLKSSS